MRIAESLVDLVGDTPLLRLARLFQGAPARVLGKLEFSLAVSDDEALDWMKALAAKEGLLAGISSGAAVAAVDKLIRRPEYTGKTIVVLLPDTAERYLGTYDL
jgi:cysteine synthase